MDLAIKKKYKINEKDEIGHTSALTPRPSLWLSRYTKLLAAVTFLLIIAGGLVTSTKSGLSVPDWPLSYGQWMPPMVGGVRYEHTHRMIASLVGLMTLILAVWIGCSESRKWLRWATIVAFGAVVAQGILGGLTVLYLLPAPISIFHACLAQTFFTLMVCLAYFTSREWVGEVPLPKVPGSAEQLTSEPGTFGSGTKRIKKPLFMLIVLAYLQLILGATVRHTANHYVLISHIVSGFLILIHALIVMNRVAYGTGSAAGRVSKQIDETCPGQNRYHARYHAKLILPSIGLGLIALFQTALGMGSFIFTTVLRPTAQIPLAKIFFVTAHQSLGALLLATAVFLYLRILRVSHE